MVCKIRVADVVEESIVDGPGIRYVVFTQGCPHHCPGCHNPQTHPFDAGRWMDTDEILAAMDENPLLAGITLSGGEPFVQAEACAVLAEAVRARGRHVMTYSGYTLEQLLQMAKKDNAVLRLLKATNLLVDGPYLEAERDLTLEFRGSCNQQIHKMEEYDLESLIC